MKTQVYDQNKMPCHVPNKVAVPDKTLEEKNNYIAIATAKKLYIISYMYSYIVTYIST